MKSALANSVGDATIETALWFLFLLVFCLVRTLLILEIIFVSSLVLIGLYKGQLGRSVISLANSGKLGRAGKGMASEGTEGKWGMEKVWN